MASAGRRPEWARRGGGVTTGAEQCFADSSGRSLTARMKGGWTRRV